MGGLQYKGTKLEYTWSSLFLSGVFYKKKIKRQWAGTLARIFQNINVLQFISLCYKVLHSVNETLTLKAYAK